MNQKQSVYILKVIKILFNPIIEIGKQKLTAGNTYQNIQIHFCKNKANKLHLLLLVYHMSQHNHAAIFLEYSKSFNLSTSKALSLSLFK